MEALLKMIKNCVLFHLKNSFRSQDIQVFVLTFGHVEKTTWLSRVIIDLYIIHLTDSRFHVERSRFSCWPVKIFILNGRDLHVEWWRFLCWMVEIFMINGQDFHVERSRFSWWTVEIFMLIGRDFHNERSIYWCWMVEIFMMNGPDFHNDRWWQVEVFIMTGTELLYYFGLNPRVRR